MRAIAVLLLLLPFLIFVAPDEKWRYRDKSAVAGYNKSEAALDRPQEDKYLCVARSINVNESLGMGNITSEDVYSGDNNEEDSAQNQRTTRVAFAIMMTAQCLVGAAGAITSPLGLLYINGNAPRTKAAFYSSIVFAMWPLGKIFGFLLGSVTTKIYVHPGDLVPFGDDDPRWIGAWWLGFFGVAIFQFIPVIPMFFFPKKLDVLVTEEDQKAEQELLAFKKSDNDDNGDQDNVADKPNSPPSDDPIHKKILFYVRDFLRLFWKLVRNPIFLLFVLSNGLNAYMVSGYGVYLVKYIEQYFRKTASEASIILAVSGAICGSVGMTIGGFITSKFKFQHRGMSFMLMFGSFSPVILMIVKIWLICPQETVIGINKPVNLLQCNTPDNCANDCTRGAQYLPVCLNGTNYVTACAAGCQSYNPESKMYEDCFCGDGKAKLGFCPQEKTNCDVNYWLFIITLGLASLTGASDVGCKITLTMRIVGDRERPVALATLFMLTSLIGWGPSSAVYGAVVDGTCLFWKGIGVQSCAFYDKDLMRNTLHILTGGIGVLAALIYTLIALLLWRNHVKRTKEKERMERENSLAAIGVGGEKEPLAMDDDELDRMSMT